MVVYDPSVPKSHIEQNQYELAGNSKDNQYYESVDFVNFVDYIRENLVPEDDSVLLEESIGLHIDKDPVLEIDSVLVEDIDEDEPLLRFTRKPVPKPGIKRQRKTPIAPIVPLNTSLYQRRARSSCPALILPLPTNTVERPVPNTRPATKTPTRTTTKTPFKTSTRPAPLQKSARK